MRDPQAWQEGMGQVHDSTFEQEKAEQPLERRGPSSIALGGQALQIQEVTEERPDYEYHVTPWIKIKKWGWEGD